jgi:hypothetical protein
MSRTDRQRLSDVFHKCDNKSATWHETTWIVFEENKSHLFWKSLCIPSMALLPLLGSGLRQKTPPFFSVFSFGKVMPINFWKGFVEMINVEAAGT